MSTISGPSRIATKDNSRALILSVAAVAALVHRLVGVGRDKQGLIDLVGSSFLQFNLDRTLRDRGYEMRLCEGKKDGAPLIAEGTILGNDQEDVPRGWIVADPVECTRELADKIRSNRRGSSVIAAITPAGCIPEELYSGCRAQKLVLPPASPVGKGRIEADSQPADIVFQLSQQFSCMSSDIVVWVLDRPWNKNSIALFQSSGADVRPIRSGDFEASILAAKPVKIGGKVNVLYGIGGLPEGVAAVPYVLTTGAFLFLQPDPLNHHIDEIREAGCEAMIGRVYQAHDLIRSAEFDCMLAVAGITESGIVRGVQVDQALSTRQVEVLFASPRFGVCHVDVDILAGSVRWKRKPAA